jgi:hypothetical protein
MAASKQPKGARNRQLFSLWVHDNNFSQADLVINPDFFPADTQIHNILEIYKPNNREKRLYLRIGAVSSVKGTSLFFFLVFFLQFLGLSYFIMVPQWSASNVGAVLHLQYQLGSIQNSPSDPPPIFVIVTPPALIFGVKCYRIIILTSNLCSKPST